MTATTGAAMTGVIATGVIATGIIATRAIAGPGGMVAFIADGTETCQEGVGPS